MWHEGDAEKTAFGGEPNEEYQRKILLLGVIKKESGEEEYSGSTDEPQESNLIMPNNPFQEMNCATTNKNDETSETSKGDIEKEKFRKFLYARAIHV